MKTLKKIYLTAIVALTSTGLTYSQQTVTPAVNQYGYNTAIGIRGGETSGITFKHFTNSNTAIEGIAGVWNHGLSLTALYEKHGKLGSVPGLKWYYGAGGHVVMFADHTRGYNYMHHWKDDTRRGQVGVGVDGVLGMEIKPRPIPVAISLDAKPYVEVLSGGSIWMAIDPSIGIKFAF